MMANDLKAGFDDIIGMAELKEILY